MANRETPGQAKSGLSLSTLRCVTGWVVAVSVSQATLCRVRWRVALWEEGERGGDEEKVDPGEGLGERMGPIFPGATMPLGATCMRFLAPALASCVSCLKHDAAHFCEQCFAPTEPDPCLGNIIIIIFLSCLSRSLLLFLSLFCLSLSFPLLRLGRVRGISVSESKNLKNPFISSSLFFLCSSLLLFTD